MPNEIAFSLCALVTLAGAAAAMSLRNLVHCALCAAIAFAGLAALFLQLGAEFAGFAQILVYVGAIAILIVFTILLTRSADVQPGAAASVSWPMGVAVGGLTLACLIAAIVSSPGLRGRAPQNVSAPVKQIGEQLMNHYVVPLETIGLLLTAALLGAIILALRDPPESEPPRK